MAFISHKWSGMQEKVIWLHQLIWQVPVGVYIYIFNMDPRGKVNALNSPLQLALWYFCPYLFILDISEYFLTTNSILPFCGLFLSQSIHYGYFLLQTLVRSFREGGEWVVTTKSFIVASIWTISFLSMAPNVWKT